MLRYSSLTILFFLSFASFCQDMIDTSPMIGERIDGPAFVREKPNGRILFELYDNLLVESTSLRKNWYQISLPIKTADVKLIRGHLPQGKYIIIDNDTIGTVNDPELIDILVNRTEEYLRIEGYTYKSNIKTTSIMEEAFLEKFNAGERDREDWENFILDFQMNNSVINYRFIDTYYAFEKPIELSPSNYRLMLMFDNNQLIGFMHARPIQTNNTNTFWLDRNFQVSYVNSWEKSNQVELTHLLNDALKAVE